MKGLHHFPTIALLLFSAGCGQAGDTGFYPSGAIAIQPVITRVTDLNFEEGDRIGLTVTTAAGTHADNAALRYDGTLFQSEGLTWYADAGAVSTFAAYHPYAEEGAPREFAVSADQQTEGCSPSDLLAAVRDDVTPSVAAVSMSFRHLLCKLNITVENSSGSAVTEITVGGTVRTASVDLAAQRVAVKSGVGASEIRAAEIAADRSYKAIVVPQQAALSIRVRTADGRSRTLHTTAKELKSGFSYGIRIGLTEEKISLRLRGAVEDWSDGGELTPDDSAETGGGASPAVLTYRGEQYAVGTLGDGRTWMLENLRMVPDGAAVSDDPASPSGVWYPATAAGAASAAASYVREKGLLYDYATAVGEAVDAANCTRLEGVRGICPAGWHLPTAAEFEALMASAGDELKQSFLPAVGYRRADDGSYVVSLLNGVLNRSYLWTSTALSPDEARTIRRDGSRVVLAQIDTRNGLPVRCVRDE